MTARSAPSAFAAFALALAAPAAALERDREQPMDITSDRIESSVDSGTATLEGSVRIVQGSLKVEADRAVVHQAKDRSIERAQLTGTPARLEQDLDDGTHMKARARQIDYALATETVVLTGDVVIEQPRGELRGERVTYELATGKMTGTGEGAASRVHLRMNPAPKRDG